MFKKIFNLFYLRAALIFVGLRVKLKYASIWQLKTKLNARKNKHELLVYHAHFEQYNSYIGLGCILESIPCFPHGYTGCFISDDAVIGKNVVIFQQVTIGSNTLRGSSKFGSPTIGDNVYIGAGAKIIGNISIGDNCRIGANAVVYENLPPNSIAVAAPTIVIKRIEKMDNRFYRRDAKGWKYYTDGSWVYDTTFEIK